jgi:hypothetical protein
MRDELASISLEAMRAADLMTQKQTETMKTGFRKLPLSPFQSSK